MTKNSARCNNIQLWNVRTTYVEIVLAKSLRTCSDRVGPMCLSINGYCKPFVYTKAVDVQHSQGHAREMLNFAENFRLPLAQAILYKRKL